MGRLARFLLGAVCAGLLLTGCDELRRIPFLFKTSDLAAAQEAIKQGEWIEAQHLLERYLTNEDAPDRRWEAWQLIVITSQRLNPNGGFALDHLRAALGEFKNDPRRALELQRQLADQYEAVRQYKNAAETLTLLSQRELPPAEALSVNTRLAALEMRLGNVDAAEDAYLNCLKLPMARDEIAQRLLGLAEARLARKDLEAAEKTVNEAMGITEARAATRGQLCFLLADIQEQKGLFEKALNMFGECRSLHPNPTIVRYREDMLKAKLAHANEPPGPEPWAPGASKKKNTPSANPAGKAGTAKTAGAQKAAPPKPAPVPAARVPATPAPRPAAPPAVLSTQP